MVCRPSNQLHLFRFYHFSSVKITYRKSIHQYLQLFNTNDRLYSYRYTSKWVHYNPWWTQLLIIPFVCISIRKIFICGQQISGIRYVDHTSLPDAPNIFKHHHYYNHHQRHHRCLNQEVSTKCWRKAYSLVWTFVFAHMASHIVVCSLSFYLDQCMITTSNVKFSVYFA